VKKIYRNPEKGNLAGVCQGLAYALDVDPAMVRIAFIVAGLTMPPFTVLTYIVMWAVLPKFKNSRRK